MLWKELSLSKGLLVLSTGWILPSSSTKLFWIRLHLILMVWLLLPSLLRDKTDIFIIFNRQWLIHIALSVNARHIKSFQFHPSPLNQKAFKINASSLQGISNNKMTLINNFCFSGPTLSDEATTSPHSTHSSPKVEQVKNSWRCWTIQVWQNG